MNSLSDTDLNMLVGGKARLWHFSPSHDRLTFRVTNNDLIKYLVLLGCEEIRTTVFWIVNQPVIEQSEITSHRLVDGKIEIHFEEALLMDHYDLQEK